MREIIYVITVLVMTFSTIKVNNEVIIQSSIQQEENVELRTFFVLENGTRFVYEEKDKKAIDFVLNYLEELPMEVRQGVKEIHFEEKKGNIAGVTKGNEITLYDFMTYDAATQRHILYHEIGHTFANELSRNKVLDFDKYIEMVNKDKNYLSNYSKRKIKENNNYSEDFADAFSMYFRDNSTFRKKHKNRYEYLDYLIKELVGDLCEK